LKGTVKMLEQNADEGQPQATETTQQNGSDATPEASGKAVTISGKTFTVNDDIAQALTEQSQSIDRRFDERSQELGELRQFKNTALQREQELQEVTNKQEAPDLGTVMYEDPNKFVDIIKGEIKAGQDQMRQEYRQEKATEKTQDAFWNSMWSENPDLAQRKSQSTDIINMISQRYLTQYPNLQNTKEVRDTFAKDTREWMKGIVGTGNGGDNPDNFVEGSSTQKETKKKEKEFVRKTTKQLQEERRENKRRAMANLAQK